MLQSERKVVGRKDMADVCRGVCSYESHAVGEYHEHGHQCDEAEDFRQYEICRGVYAHDVQGVYLLRHTHRAELRRYVGAHFSGEDKTHDGAGELEKHDFSRSISAHPSRHPRRLDVELHLYAYHRTDEERYEKHYADAVDTECRHLLDILLPVHAHTLRTGESPAHEYTVSSEDVEKLKD